MTPIRVRALVRAFYKHHGRHTLPWRMTRDPYKILVSEIILQQTQVERVIPYYTAWIKRWPSARALSEATLAEVLTAWQGLGYNRRARALHQCAEELTRMNRFPKTRAELIRLPGVGEYTAGAVLCFAYDSREILIETNVRTVVMHHFFPKRKIVSDKEIRAVLEKLVPRVGARDFTYALMDYGAHLKRSGVRLNSKVKHYRAQTVFKGSDREVRGAIVRALTQKSTPYTSIMNLFEKERRAQVTNQLTRLQSEGLVQKKGQYYSLPL